MIDINNIRKLTEAYANVSSDIDNAMLFLCQKYTSRWFNYFCRKFPFPDAVIKVKNNKIIFFVRKRERKIENNIFICAKFFKKELE